MTSNDSELVSILVPKQHLSRVYGFIATLDASAQQLTGPATDWTPELIQRQFAESPEIIKRFQKLLAQHHGKRFSTSDMATKLKAEKGSKTVAGALGAFSRRVTNRYKMPGFPFEHEWNHAEGQQYYWMDAKVAEIVKGL